MDEQRNDGGMEGGGGRERRQNDGVAIKYTAGSEEHAGCCWAMPASQCNIELVLFNFFIFLFLLGSEFSFNLPFT